MEAGRPHTSHGISSKIKKPYHSPGRDEAYPRERATPERAGKFYSNEDLNDHIFVLKNKLNDTLQENKLLKAKIVKLEKKSRGPIISPPKSRSTAHFTNGSDNQRLLMKIADLEFENKLLKDDRIKMREAIDELIGNPPPDYKKVYEKYVKQCIKLKKLKSEQGYSKSRKLYSQGIASPKTVSGILATQEGKRKNSTIVESIYEYSCKNKLEFDEIWHVINPNGFKAVNFLEFSRGIHGLGIDIPNSSLSIFFESVTKGNKMTQQQLESALTSRRSLKIVNYSDLKIPLQHLYMRLQIQRITLAMLVSGLPEVDVVYDDFFKLMHSPPFQLEKASADIISIYVFSGSSKASKEYIHDKLQEVMGSWKIFTEEEELGLDDMIRSKLGNSWESFLKKCTEIDTGKTEKVSYYDFVKICKSLDFEVSSEMEQYLKILFYTDKLQLDVVPYLSFIIAYTPDRQ